MEFLLIWPNELCRFQVYNQIMEDQWNDVNLSNDKSSRNNGWEHYRTINKINLSYDNLEDKGSVKYESDMEYKKDKFLPNIKEQSNHCYDTNSMVSETFAIAILTSRMISTR